MGEMHPSPQEGDGCPRLKTRLTDEWEHFYQLFVDAAIADVAALSQRLCLCEMGTL